jgi:chromosome segregation ATPase
VNPEDNTIIPKGTESKRNRGATEKRLADLEQNIAEMRDELEQSKAEIARLKETIRIDDRLIGALKSAIRECEDQRAAITPANLFESKE